MSSKALDFLKKKLPGLDVKSNVEIGSESPAIQKGTNNFSFGGSHEINSRNTIIDNSVKTENYNLPWYAGVALMFGSIAAVGAVRLYHQHLLDEAEAKAQAARDKATLEFKSRIDPMRANVLNVIKTFPSLEAFITSYAWQRAKIKARENSITLEVPQEIPMLSEADLNTVELFRKDWMGFFKTLPWGLKYPTSGELMNFVTIHWLIYQTNNYCCNQYPDELVPTRFAHLNKIKWIRSKQPPLADQAEAYHQTWAPKLSKIRREIWGDTPDRDPKAKPKESYPPRPRTWWQWYKGY